MENYVISLLSAFGACVCFSVIFNIRGKDLWIASLGGALAWLCYLLVEPLSNAIFANFVGGIFVSTYAEVVSRLRRSPSTCFLTIALLPLVPGAGIFYTMKFYVQEQYEAFSQKGLETLTIAGAIALGVMLVISLVRTLLYLRRHLRRQQKQAQEVHK